MGISPNRFDQLLAGSSPPPPKNRFDEILGSGQAAGEGTGAPKNRFDEILAGPSRPEATAQAGAAAPSAEGQGIVGRAWDWLNTPMISSEEIEYGNDITDPTAKQRDPLGIFHGGYDPISPLLDKMGIKGGLGGVFGHSGAVKGASDLIAGISSPLSLGLLVGSAGGSAILRLLGKAPETLPIALHWMKGAVDAGFAGYNALGAIKTTPKIFDAFQDYTNATSEGEKEEALSRAERYLVNAVGQTGFAMLGKRNFDETLGQGKDFAIEKLGLKIPLTGKLARMRLQFDPVFADYEAANREAALYDEGMRKKYKGVSEEDLHAANVLMQAGFDTREAARRHNWLAENAGRPEERIPVEVKPGEGTVSRFQARVPAGELFKKFGKGDKVSPKVIQEYEEQLAQGEKLEPIRVQYGEDGQLTGAEGRGRARAYFNAAKQSGVAAKDIKIPVTIERTKSANTVDEEEARYDQLAEEQRLKSSDKYTPKELTELLGVYRRAAQAKPDSVVYGLAKDLRDKFEETGELAANGDVIHSLVENYVTNLWEKEVEGNEAVNRLLHEAYTGDFHTNVMMARRRILANAFEGEMLGKKLALTDPIKLAANQVARVKEALAGRTFIDRLEKMYLPGSDKRPAIAPSGSGTQVGGGEDGNPALLVNPDRMRGLHINPTLIAAFERSGELEKLLQEHKIIRIGKDRYTHPSYGFRRGEEPTSGVVEPEKPGPRGNAAGGAALPSADQAIADLHAKNNGSTFNLVSGKDMGSSGEYAASIFPERTRYFDHNPSAEEIRRFRESNADLLSDPRLSLGTWRRDDGTSVVDVSYTTPNRDLALEAGRLYDQKGITHLDGKDFTFYDTGGSGTSAHNPDWLPEAARAEALEKLGGPDGLLARFGERLKAAGNVAREKIKQAGGFPNLAEVLKGEEGAFKPGQFFENLNYLKSLFWEVGRNDKQWRERLAADYGDTPRPVVEEVKNRTIDAVVSDLQNALRDAGIIQEVPSELKSSVLSKTSLKTIFDQLRTSPSVNDVVRMAKAGEPAKEWWQRSSGFWTEVLKSAGREDLMERFMKLQAAVSPQQPVVRATLQAINTLTDFVERGWDKQLPDDRELLALIDRHEAKVEGNEGLKARRDNALRALKAEALSGPKVAPMGENLLGNLGTTVLDTWMKRMFGAEQGIRDDTNISRQAIIEAHFRAAAEKLGWKPAEVQAASWAFFSTLWKLAESPISLDKLLGPLPDVMTQADVVRTAGDMADLFHQDLEVKHAVEDFGKVLGADLAAPEVAERLAQYKRDLTALAQKPLEGGTKLSELAARYQPAFDAKLSPSFRESLEAERTAQPSLFGRGTGKAAEPSMAESGFLRPDGSFLSEAGASHQKLLEALGQRSLPGALDAGNVRYVLSDFSPLVGFQAGSKLTPEALNLIEQGLFKLPFDNKKVVIEWGNNFSNAHSLEFPSVAAARDGFRDQVERELRQSGGFEAKRVEAKPRPMLPERPEVEKLRRAGMTAEKVNHAEPPPDSGSAFKSLGWLHPETEDYVRVNQEHADAPRVLYPEEMAFGAMNRMFQDGWVRIHEQPNGNFRVMYELGKMTPKALAGIEDDLVRRMSAGVSPETGVVLEQKDAQGQTESFKKFYGRDFEATGYQLGKTLARTPDSTVGFLERVNEKLGTKAEAARARLAKRGPLGETGAAGTVETGGVHAADLAARLEDYTIIGAAHLWELVKSGADAAQSFEQWSSGMVNELGEAVRPHLEKLFALAKERLVSEHQKVEAELKQAARKAPSAKAASAKVNPQVFRAAQEYNQRYGLPKLAAASKPAPEVDARAHQIADAYEQAVHEPEKPEVRQAYAALKREIKQQWNWAKEKGYKLEPWTEAGQPYKDSAAMLKDVKENKHLSIFTGGELPQGHPLAETDPETGLSYNTMFRGIHDLFGHAKRGYQFGPKGEEGAYQAHAEMFSPLARQAMFTETKAQNSWVNFGKHLRDEAGRVPVKGEQGYVPQGKRRFAEQKAAVLPEDLLKPVEAETPPVPPRPLGEVLSREPEKPPLYLWNTHDYEDIGHPALDHWNFAAHAPDGTPVMVKGRYLVHPEFAPYMKRLMGADKSPLKSVLPLNLALQAGAVAKHTLLSLSPFHVMQLGLRAVMSGVLPWVRPWDISTDPELHLLVSAGATIAPRYDISRFRSDFQEAYKEGLGASGREGLASKVPGLRGFQNWLQEFTFERLMPSLKATVGKDMLRRNLELFRDRKFVDRLMKDHPEYTGMDRVRMAAKAAAEEVNERFGGLNYRDMGRAAGTQDWLRLMTLAPDWMESELRLTKRLFDPTGGKLLRRDMLKFTAGMWVASRTLNYLLTGKFHNEAPFGVVRKDKDGKNKVYSVRTLPTDMLHLASDPVGFFTNRISPLGRAGVEGVSQREQLGKGRKMTGWQTVLDLTRNVLPIPVQTVGKALTDELPSESSAVEQAGKGMGVTSFEYRTEAQKLALELASNRSESGPVDASLLRRHQLKMEYEDRLHTGDMTVPDLEKLLGRDGLSHKEFRDILAAVKATEGLDGELASLVLRAQKLPVADFMQVWDLSTPREKGALVRVLTKKRMNYLRKAPQEKTMQELGNDALYQRMRALPSAEAPKGY